MFPTPVLIDESVPHLWDLKTALAKVGINATVVQEHDLCGEKDHVVSKTAKELGALILTTDYKFSKDTITQGEAPPDIVWIDREQMIYTPILVNALKEIVNNSYHAYSGNIRHFIYCSSTGEHQHKEVELPPPELQEVLAHLGENTAKKGLSNTDLRNIWNCSRATVWRRASKLVTDGWLHRVRKGREIRFFRGPKLKCFLNLGHQFKHLG